MNQYVFVCFALAALTCWLMATVLDFRAHRSWSRITFAVGVVLLGIYLTCCWVELQRPPLRSIGEIRIWYAFFLSLIGLLLSFRSSYRWLLPLTTLLAGMFVCLDIFMPKTFDRSLMPALRSIWFVPHVTVYIFAYALLSMATAMALVSACRPCRSHSSLRFMPLVRLGWGLLGVGMLLGSWWAKQAWGTFWSWDPKETWAAATWLAYLLYLHYAPYLRSRRTHFLWLLVAFAMLQMCWYGINLLPSAQGSVHVY